MKRRKQMKRTEIKPGKPLERKTELKRTWWKRVPREAKAAKKPAPNGPTKTRLESSEIPNAIRQAVYARDNWTCTRCGIYIPDSGRRWGLQHRRPRKAGGSRLLHTMANLVLLCGWADDPGTCTHFVERKERKLATRQGWLVPDGVKPEEWPVERAPKQWEQPGVTWVPAEPHPRQAEEAAA